MRKYLFIIAFSLFCLYCNAQVTHGFSVGYAPWGFERFRWTDELFNGDRDEGYHSWGKPVLKLDFEMRNHVFINQIGLVYSSVNANYLDSLNTNLYTENLKSIGLFYRPGFTILPYSRVQIPIFLSLGLNTFLCDGDWNGLMFDYGLLALVKVYVTNQFAIYGGYTVQWGISKLAKSFRHYPEVGLLINF